MRIINKTKNIVLSEDVLIADTLFARMKGLLGRKSLRGDQALVLRPCDSVHTFFMRFSIDVIFVDHSFCIIKCYHTLAPWRLSGFHFRCAFCVEFPAGTLSTKNTQEGDLIQLI